MATFSGKCRYKPYMDPMGFRAPARKKQGKFLNKKKRTQNPAASGVQIFDPHQDLEDFFSDENGSIFGG